MRRCVRTGPEIALYNTARLKRNNHHLPGFHLLVRNPGWFDDDISAGAVKAADVAPSQNGQTLAYEFQVCLTNFGFEFIQHFTCSNNPLLHLRSGTDAAGAAGGGAKV